MERGVMQESLYAQLPTAAWRQKMVERLGKEYAALKIFPVGKSLLGREITALCIGNPMGSALYVGATHGLEWLTSMLLIRVCARILHALKINGYVGGIKVRRALAARSISMIPCLNPDGVEIALKGIQAAGPCAGLVESACAGRAPEEIWQANARGVDINHNFNAGWKKLRGLEDQAGFDRPGPTRYGGACPESEPETAAAATFCRIFRPRLLYSLHTQGEEIYWKYGNNTPEKSHIIAQILASSSGYTPAHPEGLAAHGGLKDWFIECFGRPGFTIEVGTGKNPLGLEQFDGIYRRLEEMIMIAALF